MVFSIIFKYKVFNSTGIYFLDKIFRMNTTSDSLTNSNDESNNEIINLIKIISDQTQKFKTNNQLIYEEINAEVTNLFLKSHQLSETCLKSRNG